MDLVLKLLRGAVTRLDRLGRSVVHLVLLGAQLREHDIGLRVIEQGIGTSTAEGSNRTHHCRPSRSSCASSASAGTRCVRR